MWEGLLRCECIHAYFSEGKNLFHIPRNLNLQQFILLVDTRKLNTKHLTGWLKIHMKGGGVLSSIQSSFFEVLNLGESRLGHRLGLDHCPDPSVASVLAKKPVVNMFLTFQEEQPESLWFSYVCSAALAALFASSLLPRPEVNHRNLPDVCLLGRVNCCIKLFM